ncbi:MAG: hypothetical protein P8179_19315 [Candidatus Thiodiazotropha sp.]
MPATRGIHSRCSVIHPIGDHNHRSYFLQNQIPVIRMERSTDFFRFNQQHLNVRAIGHQLNIAAQDNFHPNLPAFV